MLMYLYPLRFCSCESYSCGDDTFWNDLGIGPGSSYETVIIGQVSRQAR